MTSVSTTHVRAGRSRIEILHDELCLTPRFRARLPNDARNPLMTHAAIGSQQEHGRSRGQAL